MPALVLQEPRRSLLDQSSRRAVELQIEFGASPSTVGYLGAAFNMRDREMTYQYSALMPSLD
jgi:hypothetical protein